MSIVVEERLRCKRYSSLRVNTMAPLKWNGRMFLPTRASLRITILVIASSNLGIYAEHEACWRSYATSHPAITVYFLRQREDIDTPRIEGNTLWTPGAERLERVFEKTVAAFQFLSPASYDFLVRTNLSSVWHFPNLVRVCERLPSTGVFCGVLGNPGISGAGMLLSPDVVTSLSQGAVRERSIWDDIDFGTIAARCGILPLQGFRYDPKSREDVDRWWSAGYHFYLKDVRNGVRDVANEVDVMRYLIEKIYPGRKK